MKHIGLLALVLLSSLTGLSQERMIGLTRNYNLGSGGIFRLDSAGADYSILPYFIEPPHGIVGKPLLHSNGKIYAAAKHGGGLSMGAILSWNPDGSDFKIEYNFGEPDQFGYTPAGGLTEGENGNIFGIISDWARGLAYEFSPSNSTLQALSHYTWSLARNTETTLTSTKGGWLYGTSKQGGQAWRGTIFRISQRTGAFQVLYEFPNQTPYYPSPELVSHPGGKLYGYCTQNEENQGSALFRVNEQSGQVEFLDPLPKEVRLIGRLITDEKGNLYGVSGRGGKYEAGMIFRTDSLGKRFITLHSFGEGDLSLRAMTPLEWGDNGLLYGFLRNSATQQVSLYQVNPYGDDFEILSTTEIDHDERPNNFFLYTPEGCWGSVMTGGQTNYVSGYEYESIFGLEPSSGGQTKTFHTYDFSRNGYYLYPQLSTLNEHTVVGIARKGGKYNHGTLFEVDRCGNNFRIVHDFREGKSFTIVDEIMESSGESLLVYVGGIESGSAVKLIRVDMNSGSDSLLHEFNNFHTPPGRLVSHSDGYLYGVARKFHESIPDSLYYVLFRLDPDGANLTELIPVHSPSVFPSSYGSWMSHSNGRIYGLSYSSILEFDPGTLELTFRPINFHEDQNISFIQPIEGPDHHIYGSAHRHSYDPYLAMNWYSTSIWKMHPDTGSVSSHHRVYFHFDRQPTVDGPLSISPNSMITCATYQYAYPGSPPDWYGSDIFSVDTAGIVYTVQPAVKDSTGQYLVGNLLYLPGGDCPPVNAPEVDDDPPILSADVPVGVYPNPVQDFLIIKTDGIPIKQIALYDLQGKEMIVPVSGSDLDHSSILQLEYLPAGVYLVLIYTPDEVFKRKILKL